MRREIYRSAEAEGRALLARCRAVQVALTTASGAPLLRTCDAVIDDGVLALHGAPAGGTLEGVGRPVVAGACEIIASFPGEPAATYHVSVQAAGMLEPLDDRARRARVCAALHLPTTSGVVQLRLDRMTYEAELGQDRPPAERLRVIEQLWQRGATGDVAATSRLLTAFPELGPPAYLRLPEAVRDRALTLHGDVDADGVEEALPLLENLYWLSGIGRAAIRASALGSTARVAARDGKGRVVAFARALSDGKCAWVYDVVVAEHLRNARIGAALMNVLLDHPAVRNVRHVRLTTRDAMPFYRRLGFTNLDETPRYPWRSTEMIRPRQDAPVLRSERAYETEARRVAADDREEQRPRD